MLEYVFCFARMIPIDLGPQNQWALDFCRKIKHYQWIMDTQDGKKQHKKSTTLVSPRIYLGYQPLCWEIDIHQLGWQMKQLWHATGVSSQRSHCAGETSRSHRRFTGVERIQLGSIQQEIGFIWTCWIHILSYPNWEPFIKIHYD